MVLTYEYILKEELFEDLLRVTRGEIDECVAIVQQAHDAMRAAHANFNNLRGGIYRAADFVVWLFSFSAIYRNLSVMATILGLHVGQVRVKFTGPQRCWRPRSRSATSYSRRTKR